MRKPLAIIATIALALTSVCAWADSRDFTLYNRTGYTITGFFFSTPESNEWVPMEGEQIGPHASTHVHFTQTGPCNMQFRVVTSQGTADFMRPFDFCRLHWISIYYDAPTDTYTAREGLTPAP